MPKSIRNTKTRGIWANIENFSSITESEQSCRVVICTVRIFSNGREESNRSKNRLELG